MLNRRSCLLLVALSLGLAPAIGRAQIAQDFGPIRGGPPVLYRLDAEATYTQGCYPPCLCPIFTTDDLFGTFLLQYKSSDPQGFNHYSVGQVNWLVDFGGTDHRVTGNGRYSVGGAVAVMHRLELDLAMDDGPVQHFDSGLIAGGGGFPAIDITVSLNGMVCYDEVYELVASPVPASAIRPYVLDATTYEEGCYPPCDCLLRQWPAGGTYSLVPLNAPGDPRLHYALVRAHFATISPQVPPERSYRGFGIYSRTPAANEHRLVADLTDQDQVARRFDSGAVSGGAGFPRVDIDVAVNGFVCFDYVFLLRSKPE